MKRLLWPWIMLSLIAGTLAVLLYPVTIGRWRMPPCRVNTAKHSATCIVLASRQYEQEFGNLPQGTAGEILGKLEGINSKKIAYLDLGGQARTPDGGWLDPQGTPYRITTTGTNIEVRSAGPDGKFGTPDDIAAP